MTYIFATEVNFMLISLGLVLGCEYKLCEFNLVYKLLLKVLSKMLWILIYIKGTSIPIFIRFFVSPTQKIPIQMHVSLI